MKRFLLPSPPNPEGIIWLSGKDYHYLVRVRRLKAGQGFDAALPDGKETQVHILSTADNILVGKCHEGTEKQTHMCCLPPLALFQGLAKGGKMDLIVRQAAESGVSIIAPFESGHSAARLNKPSIEKKNEKVKRWERIVREARQQSGSAIETKVLPPCSFEALLEYWDSLKKTYKRPLGLLLHQAPLAKGSFHDYLGINPDLVALAIGPEGGFSPGEVSQFLEKGWKPLEISYTVLRTETAALYGTAAIRTILLEKETWAPGLKE